MDTPPQRITLKDVLYQAVHFGKFFTTSRLWYGIVLQPYCADFMKPYLIYLMISLFAFTFLIMEQIMGVFNSWFIRIPVPYVLFPIATSLWGIFTVDIATTIYHPSVSVALLAALLTGVGAGFIYYYGYTSRTAQVIGPAVFLYFCLVRFGKIAYADYPIGYIGLALVGLLLLFYIFDTEEETLKAKKQPYHYAYLIFMAFYMVAVGYYQAGLGQEIDALL